MEQLLIRDLPTGTKAALRARAKRHHRSLEAEARAALAAAVAQEPMTLVDLLSTDDGADIDFEPDRLGLNARVAELPAFDGRVLAFDLAAARRVATYRVPEHAPYDDALMAAIADANQMTVVTRNTKHFRPLDVACIDPWQPTATLPG